MKGGVYRMLTLRFPLKREIAPVIYIIIEIGLHADMLVC